MRRITATSCLHPTKCIRTRAFKRRMIVDRPSDARGGTARGRWGSPGGIPRRGREDRLHTGDGGCCNISTMNSDGSHVTQLTHVASGSRRLRPLLVAGWNRDRVRPAECRPFADLDHERGRQRRASAPRGPFFVDLGPSYSPDGTRIVFTRCRPDFTACAIYRMNALGRHSRRSRPFKVSVTGHRAEVLPGRLDNRFNSTGRGGVQSAVYLMNADGSNVRRLTRPGLIATSPEWSPDGSRIVFTTHCCALGTPRRSGSSTRTRRELHQLTFPGRRHDFTPSFAPSGDKIAFERDSRTSRTSPCGS